MQYDPAASRVQIYGDFALPITQAAADGAVTPKGGVVFVTKGSAAALTLAAPIPGADDGKAVTFIAATAFAHVLTCPTDGFNAKGASGTATLAAAVGNGLTVTAFNGHWYASGAAGCTIA